MPLHFVDILYVLAVLCTVPSMSAQQRFDNLHPCALAPARGSGVRLATPRKPQAFHNPRSDTRTSAPERTVRNAQAPRHG
ncbi:hypothetical protein GCM10010495_66500 [Kitasatospora herbaricolor]|nr:hypothetical protein GCM10010495_66500 [Kitasatospora herbaricolor]